MCRKQGQKRQLDTPKRKTERRERERKEEGEREREREREVKGIERERLKGRVKSS